MRTVTMHGKPSGIDSLDGTHRVALDTRNLDKATDGIAGKPKVVFHSNLRRFLYVII
jgi:hypothetical protein